VHLRLPPFPARRGVAEQAPCQSFIPTLAPSLRHVNRAKAHLLRSIVVAGQQ
jgi:hypothetical protein